MLPFLETRINETYKTVIKDSLFNLTNSISPFLCDPTYRNVHFSIFSYLDDYYCVIETQNLERLTEIIFEISESFAEIDARIILMLQEHGNKIL